MRYLNIKLNIVSILILTLGSGAEGTPKVKTSNRMPVSAHSQKVAVAIQAIKKKYPNFRPSDFEMKVISSDVADRATIRFSQRFALIPRESTFFYTIEWSQGLGIQLADEFSNQQERPREIGLFIPTAESKKAIAFVRQAAKKAGQPIEHGQIFDKGDKYFITTGGPGWDRSYYIDKKTGKVTEASTGTDVEPPT